MFTGIIEAIGTVKSIDKTSTDGKITISSVLSLKSFRVGDSMAVNGLCLTATKVDGSDFTADISAESLRVSNLGNLTVGSKVNLEPALTPNRPLGGHIVTGHVDGTGIFEDISSSGNGKVITFNIPKDLLLTLIKKGSITVNGVSLTIARLTSNGFETHIIPHTLESTTLGILSKGDNVNIETDIIGKYVERFTQPYSTKGVTEKLLIKHGFINKS
ncbi:MAG: riboflavin synthase [Deltaproteobacteria bacterium]|nr:riboflavin synthase [Deltaproteobacteria bacterium]